jgi:hypothetical protein
VRPALRRPAVSGAYGECWRLAWPLILANLSVPLLGLVHRRAGSGLAFVRDELDAAPGGGVT